MKLEIREDNTDCKTVHEDYLKIQLDDPPGIKRLKKLAMIDSSELEQFEEELKKEKKH